MSTALAGVGRLELPALGTTASLVVADPDRMSHAEAALRAELVAVDEACSRFRVDSEISQLHREAGGVLVVGSWLAEALTAGVTRCGTHRRLGGSHGGCRGVRPGI